MKMGNECSQLSASTQLLMPLQPFSARVGADIARKQIDDEWFHHKLPTVSEILISIVV